MKDLKNFILLPAKVSTFLESSKLFVEESKTLPSDFCMKTSVTVTANVQNHCALGVTLVYKDYVHMGSLHSPPVHMFQLSYAIALYG